MYTKWEVFEDKDIIITDIGMFSAAERRGKCAIMYCIFNCLLTGKISRIVAQNAAPQPDTAGPSIVQPYIPSVMEPSVAVSSIAELPATEPCSKNSHSHEEHGSDAECRKVNMPNT